MARDDAKTAKDETSEFEADDVAEVGRRGDEFDGLTSQLRQKAGSTAAGSKELAAVHVEWELHRA